MGACFGQSGEYERPMWYALNGTKPEYNYSFNYQNWYPSVEQECKNTTENVGLFELTPFSKMKSEVKRRMRNYKDYVLLILKMKLENALIPICSMRVEVLKLI